MLIDTVWKSRTAGRIARHPIAAENAFLQNNDEFAWSDMWSEASIDAGRHRCISTAFAIIRRISPRTKISIGPEFSSIRSIDDPYINWSYRTAHTENPLLIRTHIRGLYKILRDEIVITLGSDTHPIQIAFHEAFHAIQYRYPIGGKLSEQICDWGFDHYADFFICGYSANAIEVQARLFELWCIRQISSNVIPKEILALFDAIRSGEHVRQYVARRQARAEAARAPGWRRLLHAVVF